MHRWHVVYIFEGSGEAVWKGRANDEGLIDTDCILKCPAVYEVVPKNERCQFFPESQKVEVPCCPDVAKVTFQCECEEEGGRIIVRLLKNASMTRGIHFDETGEERLENGKSE